MRKFVSLFLALSLLCGVYPLMAMAEEAPVVLEWYVAEGPQPDNQTVFDGINAYLLEKVNATVNFHFVPVTEYSEKVSTILMSGQEVDIINAHSQLNYVQYAKMSAFYPMDELLKEYAPNTYAMIPESYWNAMKIDGVIYGIPSYKDSCQMYSMHYNQTMAEDLGMELPATIRNYQDVIPLLYEAYELRKAKYPNGVGEFTDLYVTRNFPEFNEWAQCETINGLAVVNVPGIEDFEGKGAGETVFNKYDTQEFRDYCLAMAQIVADGVAPENVWYYDPDRLYSKAGMHFLYQIGSGYVTVSKDANGTEFDTAMIPYEHNIAFTNYMHQAVECISSASKNPEKAMQVLELINTDDFVATALRFGLEGTHWVAGEDGVISVEGTKNEDPNNRAHYYWYGAQFGALIHCKVAPGYPANFMELILAANDNAIGDTNMGFIFDPTPVANEIAACEGVIGTYETNLHFGFIPLDNVNANVDAFLADLEANNVQAIIDEAQAQLDAWRAANK